MTWCEEYKEQKERALRDVNCTPNVLSNIRGAVQSRGALWIYKTIRKAEEPSPVNSAHSLFYKNRTSVVKENDGSSGLIKIHNEDRAADIFSVHHI